MTFVPRTFETILNDMINYVKANSTLTDFEIGSVVRTILEAASLEDEEQYFQIVQFLDAFNIQNANGPELDKRVADYGIVRLQPSASTGSVAILDGLLIKSNLTFDISIAGVSLILDDSSAFPNTGFPYTVRVGEGTLAVEDVSVTANNLSTNTLTCSACVNAHSAGDRASFVSGVSDRTLAAGIQVQVPSLGGAPAILFITTATGVLVNGNYESTLIKSKSTTPGSTKNIGVGQISQFTSTSPFNGALVTNKTNFSGGRDLESDSGLKERALAQIQALSKGTILALQQASLGVSDPNSGQRVVTANVVEDFINDEVKLYIDDGTGFTPDQTTLAQSTLSATAALGATQITVASAANFPGEGQLVISPNAVSIETVAYTAVNYTTNVISLAAPLANNHLVIGDEVAAVDAVSIGAEPGSTFFKTKKYPVARNSQRLWVDNGSGLVLKTRGVDYLFNLGNGEIQFFSGLANGANVVMHYTYYTGLIFQVQKVINGDSADPVNFPGVEAAGIQVIVQTPVIRRITVQISLTAKPGFNEDDLRTLVQEAVENYISSLGIGDNVILASIIQVAMNINGVFDVIPVEPTGDIVVLENELPVPFASDGTSLVSVL